MTASRPDLSLLVPCYGEGARVDRLVEAALAWGSAHPDHRFELLCVDDGSLDDTGERLAAHARAHPEVRVLSRTENGGKGAALRIGVADARGDVIIFFDADLAVDLTHVDAALAAMVGGAQVVIGSRALPGSEVTRPQGLFRRWLGSGYRALAVVWLGLRVSDVTCGFKAFDGMAARSLFERTRAERWGLDAELLYLARSEGLVVAEIPVSWADGESSSVRVGRDVFGALKELVVLRRRHGVPILPTRVTPAP
jgi:glycosyltransferase involved in cell wall biosynthesis